MGILDKEWWRGTLFGTAKLPQALRDMAVAGVDAARQPGPMSLLTPGQLEQLQRGEPVKIEGANDPAAAVASLTPLLGPAIDAYKESKGAGSDDQFESGKAIGSVASILATAGIPGLRRRGAPPIKRNIDLPNLRTMTTDEAVRIARGEPHLIPAGGQSDSAYIGAPSNVQSKPDLTRNRRAVDRGINAGAEGGDWYDRYRAAVTDVTGGDPVKNKWMANAQGQWSAGVDPSSELGFTLKETNASIAGMPTKAARPAQHAAHEAAIEAKDPRYYMLGEKTGEYADRIRPRAVGEGAVGGATGVNDFRWATEHGFEGPDGTPYKRKLTSAQHKFLDYETALAIDRANRRGAAGRSDWTGEQVQAAGWVRQKADAILEERPALVEDRLKAVEKQAKKEGWSSDQKAQATQQAYTDADREAFALANRQIGDFFPKHTAYATHESRPGPSTGHLPGLLDATPDQIAAYHADPASTWATAPGGRDAIYSGTQIPGTGVAVRTRPTIPMQGMYDAGGEAGVQFNPGDAARPLVAFDNASDSFKTMPEADRTILRSAETLRAAIDAQDAGAAHKVWAGGPVGKSTSLSLPMDRALTQGELRGLAAAMEKHDLPNVVDTGEGATVTNFGMGPFKPKSRKEQSLLYDDVAKVLPGAVPDRVSVDSIYADLSDRWQQGVGSGAVTRRVLDEVNTSPRLRAAFDQNEFIAERARAKRERDVNSQHGPARDDLQNFREIVGTGPGWVRRMEDALASGKISLPAIGGVGVAGLLSPTAFEEDERWRAR